MNLWLPASTAFLASGLEAVEALTVVLAVGLTWGWRPALTGTFFGVALVALVVALLGPLVATVPLGPVRLIVGAFLLLFGMAWLRKAVQRYGGRRALRDEDANFSRHVEALGAAHREGQRGALLTAFKSVTLELLEVAIIVVTVGGSVAGGLAPAAAGAMAAILVVVAAGALLRAPLARVPANALGFAVGVMLVAYGTFWSGEGLGIQWWHEDLAILYLAALYALAALACVAALRVTARPPAATV
jgi:Ca2+/H+ antiporter, TMEM165/GDT1 family